MNQSIFIKHVVNNWEVWFANSMICVFPDLNQTESFAKSYELGSYVEIWENGKLLDAFFKKNIFSSKVQFTQWNDQKFDLHLREKILDFYVDPGEIWYVKLGVNVGFEQNGKSGFQRPVLVVSRIGMLFFILPLSTKNKINKFYYNLTSVRFDRPSLAVLSQARVIDKRRFINIIGRVSDEELLVIKKLLRNTYLPGA